jgi:Tfp pilus assembly protein PilF
VRRALVVGLLLGAGCAVHGPHPRALHYVDGDLVYSRPATSASYEAYVRARLALSVDPPHLDVAQAEIERALKYDARDPHLWTAQSEIAWKAGDEDRAVAAARRALTLRPGYPPAERMMAQLRGGQRSVQR